MAEAKKAAGKKAASPKKAAPAKKASLAKKAAAAKKEAGGAAKKAKTKKATSSPRPAGRAPTREEIAERAYQIHEREGGDHEQNWLRAGRGLGGSLSGSSDPALSCTCWTAGGVLCCTGVVTWSTTCPTWSVAP